MKLGKPDIPEALDIVNFTVVTQLVKNLLPFMQPEVTAVFSTLELSPLPEANWIPSITCNFILITLSLKLSHYLC